MDTELFYASKVAPVVRHNGLATGSNSDFPNHVVARIPERWSPKVEHLLTVRHSTDVVEQVVNVSLLNVFQFSSVALERIFMLQHKRDGDAGLEDTGVDRGE